MIKEVKILGHRYKIIELEKEKSTDSHLGLVEYVPCTIKILKDMHPQQKRRVLLHEILHVIFQENHLDDKNFINTDLESIINIVSTGLDNVDAIKTNFEEEKDDKQS